MSTASVSTAKCTSVRRLNSKIGSRGSRSCLVLLARLFHRLAGERVLQLQRGDGNAVQAEGDIERLLRARREVQLPGQPQAVRGVTRLQLRVQLVRRLEVGRVQRPPIALEAVAQRCQRAVGVHPLAQVTEDLLAGLLPVQRLQPGPLLRLGGTDESQYGLGKDRPLAVEAVAVHGYVAVGQKLGFDDGLKGSFAMSLLIPLLHLQGHQDLVLKKPSRHKNLLLKVMVCCEGFVESILLHDHKTRTIDETPLLSGAHKPAMPDIERRIYMHNVHIW